MPVGTGTPLLEGTPDDGPGFVGASYDEIAPESGRLFLGFNDQKQALGDNTKSEINAVADRDVLQPLRKESAIAGFVVVRGFLGSGFLGGCRLGSSLQNCYRHQRAGRGQRRPK